MYAIRSYYVSIGSWVSSSGVNYFAFLGFEGSPAGGLHTLCQDLYLEPYTKYVDISFTYKFSDPLPPPDTFKAYFGYATSGA